MKPYLIRGGADLYHKYSPHELIKHNVYGGNTGNLMFLYGVSNILTTSKTFCVPTYYQYSWSDKDIEEINQNYSALILPCADAFRKDFIPELQAFTQVMKKLTIPCIVVGIGLRAEYDPDLKRKRPFDEDVKAFITEVLKHSSIIGLRGEITADYLTNLGFHAEKDFTVIGCPSLYMHGEIQRNNNNSKYKIGINLNGIADEDVSKFYVNLLYAQKDIYLIQQRHIEFLDLYYGMKIDLSTRVSEFPKKNIFQEFDYHKLKKEGRVKYFWDVLNWIHYLEDFDLFIGSRFHGTVAAILAGVPSIMTPIDARTQELCAYHHIPVLLTKDIEAKCNIEEIKEKIEGSHFLHNQHENLLHYIEFLKCNHIYSVFDEGADISLGNSPMEQVLLNNRWHYKAVKGFDECKRLEKIERKIDYYVAKVSSKIKRMRS